MDKIDQNFAKKFYRNKLWRRLSKEVLIEDKRECLHHKQKGQYVKATICHHVNYLLLHPELGLEKYYKDDNGNIKRNLISVCFLCHEEIHQWAQKKKEIPLTPERW